MNVCFMKIMHVLWGLKYGGAETMLVDIVNRQCRNHTVEILLINDDVNELLLKQIDSSIPVVKINRPLKNKNFFYILKLNSLVLFSAADIIHFHQENIIRYLFVRFLKRNFCLTVHSNVMDVAYVKQFKFIFAISTKVKEEIWYKTGREAVLIPNGIDIQKFNKKKKYHSECFRIVQIGGLNHLWKGQHIALEALRQIVQIHGYQYVHLDFIGDGDSKGYLQELSNQLNMNSYITFEGNRSREYIQKNLSSYNLLIQPSIIEGFGLAVLEAMAAMVPTLISDVEGMKMISKNGELSYTFQSGNTDDLAQKIIYIIHLPVIKMKSLTYKAYNYVSAHFDITSTSDNYLRNYELILNNIKKTAYENSNT